jgi:hypothetical protein
MLKANKYPPQLLRLALQEHRHIEIERTQHYKMSLNKQTAKKSNKPIRPNETHSD